MTSNQKLSILAGNPLFDDKQGHSRENEYQLDAFRKAIELASEVQDRIARVYVAFDHVGRYERFLKPDIPARRRKRPRLADLKDSIHDQYSPFLLDTGLSTEDIYLIPEAQARLHMLELSRNNRDLRQITNFEAEESNEPCNMVGINCRGIVAEMLRRPLNHGDMLEAFIEHEPERCRVGTFQAAADIVRNVLGIQKRIRIQMNQGARDVWRTVVDINKD